MKEKNRQPVPHGWPAALLVLGFLVGAACSGGPLKVGVLLPETGDSARYAEEVRRGLTLATDGVDQVGGRPLELDIRDTGGAPSRAAEVFRELAESGVYAVLGPLGDGELREVAPLATENEILVLSPTSGDEEALESSWVFGLAAGKGLEANRLAGFARGMKPPVKYISVAWARGTYGSTYKNEFIPLFKNRKGEVIEVDVFSPGLDADGAATLATKLAAERPDAVLVVSPLVLDAVAMNQALRGAGFEGRVLATSTANLPAALAEAGAAAEGLHVAVHSVDWEGSPAARQFAQAYRTRFGGEPTVWAANAYDAFGILAAAVEKEPRYASSTLGVLRRTSDYAGAGGTISFDQDGGIVRIYTVQVVRGGELVPPVEEGL